MNTNRGTEGLVIILLVFIIMCESFDVTFSYLIHSNIIELISAALKLRELVLGKFKTVQQAENTPLIYYYLIKLFLQKKLANICLHTCAVDTKHH